RGGNPTTGNITIHLTLGGGLSIAPGIPFHSVANGVFLCTAPDASTLTCPNVGYGLPLAHRPGYQPLGYEFIVIDALAPGIAGGPFSNTVTVGGGGEIDTSNNVDTVNFNIVAPVADLSISITHEGSPPGSPNFQAGSTDGSVTVTLTNVGTASLPGPTLVFIAIQGGLTRIESTTTSTPGSLFTCAGTQTIQCSTGASFAPGQTEVIRFNVQAPPSDLEPDIIHKNIAFLINFFDANG